MCEEVLRLDRVYPVVGLSCQFGRREPALALEEVRGRVWPTVRIYVIESRESRTINRFLPDGLGAYNGAARIWWPGVVAGSESTWHPLIYDNTGAYGEDALERLAAEFAHSPPGSIESLSPEEAVLRLRSLPRPAGATPSERGSASVIPLATRKDLRRLTSDLRRSEREYPIVVLTVPDACDDTPPFLPSVIRPRLDAHIPVYVLGGPDLSRRLEQAFGAQLAVGDGDARIYWPGVTQDSDPAEHPRVPARSDGDRRDPADRLIAALDLSRPRVRGHVAAMDGRVQTAEQRAAETQRELREARAERSLLVARVEAAEASLATAEGQLAALRSVGLDQAELESVASMDSDARLHRLISREWTRALPAADRAVYPLRYTFGANFLDSVEKLTGTSLERIAWVCAMVASGRARDMPGIEPHQLRATSSATAAQLVRSDDAKAWICRLLGEGASRLQYWVRTDTLTEFAAVAVHDSIGLV